MCVDTKHKQTGKASLADIFFQKLFGKRRACQNEHMEGYMAVWKVMRCMEGYVAVWKVMWLYGRLCGCLEGYVAVWLGYVAVWLGYVAVWLGYVAVWLGSVAGWLGSGDLERIWLGSGDLERKPQESAKPRNPRKYRTL